MKILVNSVVAIAATLAGLSPALEASAAPLPVGGLAPALDGALPVEKTQFWGGRNYCFYPDGWHGPGFYWCGYAWHRGFGWGGPRGWHGWGGGGPGFHGGGRGFGGHGGFGGGHGGFGGHGGGHPGGGGHGGGGHGGGGHGGGGHPH